MNLTVLLISGFEFMASALCRPPGRVIFCQLFTRSFFHATLQPPSPFSLLCLYLPPFPQPGLSSPYCLPSPLPTTKSPPPSPPRPTSSSLTFILPLVTHTHTPPNPLTFIPSCRLPPPCPYPAHHAPLCP